MRVIYLYKNLGPFAVLHSAYNKAGELVFSTITTKGATGHRIARARLAREGHKLSKSRWASRALEPHLYHH